MNNFRKWALLLFAIGVAGCVDDHPTIVRDTLAVEGETIDGLMKVVDEASAKEYESLAKAIKDKKELVDARKVKWVDNQDKKDLANYKKYKEFADATLSSNKMPSPEMLADKSMDGASARYIVEMLAVQKAKEREVNRIKNVLAEAMKTNPGGQFPSLIEVVKLIDPPPK